MTVGALHNAFFYILSKDGLGLSLLPRQVVGGYSFFENPMLSPVGVS